MGNADFNAGKKDEGFAYEIEELYELKEPLSLKAMQERYEATFPQRFSYVMDNMIQDIVLEDQIRLFWLVLQVYLLWWATGSKRVRY